MLLFQSLPLCFRELRVNLCLRRLEFFQLRKRPEALLVRFAIFQLLLGMQNLQPAQRLQHLYQPLQPILLLVLQRIVLD